MLKFDAEKLRDILIHEEGYKDNEADAMKHALPKLNSKLQKYLDQWMEDRTVSEELNIEGVTLKIIMEKRRIGFCSALIFMNVYIDKPELAKKFLKRPIFHRGKPHRKRS
ncbi:hypothetical protein [Thermoflavimicrobium daqui]|uniref:Uncharacterized protein n=1 Tax=Thermoflavimicrobium daqui TaxID=2137476 RepID=A0A364K2F7_9BACL|nr:hypothetical protein [Thermoflavimicrobium daqui]RAL22602.1 hypothetical protein DL897_14430 [Thermoflavimicrobium daqui]